MRFRCSVFFNASPKFDVGVYECLCKTCLVFCSFECCLKPRNKFRASLKCRLVVIRTRPRPNVKGRKRERIARGQIERMCVQKSE